PGIPGHIPQLGQSNQPELARDLLAQAGYGGGKGFPTVDLVAPPLGSRFFTRLGDRLVEVWREELGITVRWDGNLSFEAYKLRVEQDEPCLLAWGWIADYPDPDNFLSAMIKTTRDWHNSEYEQLIDEARRLTDQQARLSLYRRAEEILSDQAVVVPLLYSRKHFLAQPWVKEFPTSAKDDRYWKDIVVEREMLEGFL
ncbi:MAG: ABC transporter substrate-binding protein, partial [Anaerolineales bacterium]|nr:ABC transporter substrate-binding protein [Anaerolineales bacterium]